MADSAGIPSLTEPLTHRELPQRVAVDASTARIGWVDVTKGLGIVLMFYGHFLQVGIAPRNSIALDELRLIYSFHMPLFFMLSGFFFKPWSGFISALYRLAIRRLLPVVFFALCLLPLWSTWEIRAGAPFWHDLMHVGIDYLQGFPELDWVTWFLICLFSCEVLAQLSLAHLRGFAGRVLFGLVCILGGVVFSRHSITPADGWLYFIGRTWFLSEAIVALGFYSIGHALYPYLNSLSHHRIASSLVLMLAAVCVLTTFRLNHPHSLAVMMAAREHGNALEFAMTALAGSVATLMLGMQLARSRILRWLGSNTLILLGLNGLFFHFLNQKFGRLVAVPNSLDWVTIDALTITALSLFICVPAVYFLNRYLPQLVGKSQLKGPWLPALERGR